MKTVYDLTTEFFEETGVTSINSQDEPDIEYVQWLENRLCEQINVSQSLPEITGGEIEAWAFEKYHELENATYFIPLQIGAQWAISELKKRVSNPVIVDELKDIIDCICKYDSTETLENKGRYFEVIQRDLKRMGDHVTMEDLKSADEAREEKPYSKGQRIQGEGDIDYYRDEDGSISYA